MKKLSLVVIVALAILVTGCAKKVNEVGNSLEIKLKSNPTTGYSWEYTNSDSEVVEISDEYDNSNCPDDVDGCGGTEIFKVKPLKEGKVTLEFEYKRVWEEDSTEYTAKYEIEVDKDLNIKESHSGSYFKED